MVDLMAGAVFMRVSKELVGCGWDVVELLKGVYDL